MPKNKITKQMCYAERLDKWVLGICPYCDGKAVETDTSKNGGTHYRCNNKDCRAENHFSKGAGKE